MWRRDSRIVKGTNSIWSVMLSILALLAVVWLIAMNVSDPIWRWSIAGIGTIVCLGSPGGLACIFWLGSSQFRKQWRDYRRGGPPPGYSPGAPWQASQVGKKLQEYTDHYLSKETILGNHSEDFQTKLKEKMYGSVAAIYGAENPLLKCRENLAVYVVDFADWSVLCLVLEETPQLKKGDVRLSPYISGEIHRYIRNCAQYNGELATLISKNKYMSDEELISWENARSCAFLYLMNCMNAVRGDVNDCDLAIATKADWFRPFVKSMLIWKEDDYRSKIGLPTLLPNLHVGLARRHSTFLTYVLEGARDPLSHWESVHELKHGDVS